MVKSLSVLGSTGSIGQQTLTVAEHTGIRVAALTANRKIDLLEEQVRKFRPELVAVYDEDAAKAFRTAVADMDVRVVSGMEGLSEAAAFPSSDCVVTAVSGSVGLKHIGNHDLESVSTHMGGFHGGNDFDVGQGSVGEGHFGRYVAVVAVSGGFIGAGSESDSGTGSGHIR